MTQRIKKIGAILMSIVVLLSTMSFTIHNKYCQGELVDTTFFLEPESCDSDDSKNDCFSESGCCDHERIVIVGQNELTQTVVVFSTLEDHFFVESLPNYNLNSFKRLLNKSLLKAEYSPPYLFVNRQTDHQVFLI